jgi:aspartate aminotransferase
VVDSISKVFSSCGTRVGFIVSRNQKLMNNILKYAQLRLCPPMIGQHMAVACFTDRSNYLEEVKNEYNRRRLYLYERLSKMEGVTSYLPKAAFYIMTELPVPDATEFCKWLLSDFSADGQTIMMAPGNGFYLNQEYGKSQVRIAFVLGIPDLAIAMDILELALKQYAKVVKSQKQLSYSYT